MKRVLIINDYINNYLIKNKMCKRDFCFYCGIKRNILRYIKRKKYNKVKIHEVMRISEIIDIPIFRLIVELEPAGFIDYDKDIMNKFVSEL